MAMVYTTQLPDGTTVQWVIDNVVDSFGPAGLSQPQRYKRVNFHTYRGDSSYVEVQLQPGWVDRAVELIQQHVNELYELVGRQGPPVT